MKWVIIISHKVWKIFLYPSFSYNKNSSRSSSLITYAIILDGHGGCLGLLVVSSLAAWYDTCQGHAIELPHSHYYINETHHNQVLILRWSALVGFYHQTNLHSLHSCVLETLAYLQGCRCQACRCLGNCCVFPVI